MFLRVAYVLPGSDKNLTQCAIGVNALADSTGLNDAATGKGAVYVHLLTRI